MRCAYFSSEVTRRLSIATRSAIVISIAFCTSAAGCARAADGDDPIDNNNTDAGKITDAGADVPHDYSPPDQASPSNDDDSSPPYNGPDTSFPDSGPIGGGDAGPISACTGKTRVMTASDLFLADFESTALQGFYDYQATGALNVLALGTPGALSTGHAGHLAATGLTSFGAGMGVTESCTDTSALDGISFWAKGTAGGDNKIQFQVAIPQTHAVANGGDCVTKCFDHPSKQLVLTSTWTQYVVPFSQLAQAGFGTPATYSGIIMALNWVSVDATSVDFWIDEIALYKGTAQTGPVGHGTAPVDAGITD